MLIGEISKKARLSKDTIRFYERKGLIKVGQSNSEFNNYKNYTSENLQRLQLIKKTKRFGFTLNEIAELLELVDVNKANCSIFRNKINVKISDINNRIQELEDVKEQIYKGIQDAKIICKIETVDENCKILN